MARPEPLLIYYGWPSAINNGHDEDFNQYAYVVLGATLENEDHPDHWPTSAIIEHRDAYFYGYIDLGVNYASNLSMRQIKRSMRRWKRMGVRGVLLDDFGFDWGVGPKRQNNAIDAAHKLGLSVIANVWNPHLGLARDTHLRVNDYLLAESFYINSGTFDEKWRQRAEWFRIFSRIYGMGVMSVATAGKDGHYPRLDFEAALSCAEEYGHVACGWGEWNYSAQDCLAPWRERT